MFEKRRDDLTEFCVWCQKKASHKMWCPECKESHFICNECYQAGVDTGNIETEPKKLNNPEVLK